MAIFNTSFDCESLGPLENESGDVEGRRPPGEFHKFDLRIAIFQSMSRIS